jgi:hypothetical protein
MSAKLESRIRALRRHFPESHPGAEEQAQHSALSAARAQARPSGTRARDPWRRLLRQRRSIALVVGAALPSIALGAALAALMLPSSTEARAVGQPYPGPAFTPTEGWTTVAVSGWPNSKFAPLAWAANVPVTGEMPPDGIYSDPDSPLRNLPDDGIVLVVWLGSPDQVPAPPTREGTYVDRELPLQLSDADVELNWRGMPNGHTPQYLLLGRVKEQRVDVRVYFGTTQPSDDLVQVAQEELERLNIPDPETFG